MSNSNQNVAVTTETLEMDLASIIEEMFMILTPKEKDVIIQRFSLDNKPKRTLESIGKKFAVTRERIRQIQSIALKKLRRTSKTTKLAKVNEIANTIIKENGGVLLEERLVSAILNSIGSKEKLDGYIVKLALSINVDLKKSEKTNVYKPFWRMADIKLDQLAKMIKTGIKTLKKKKDTIDNERLVNQIKNQLELARTFDDKTIVSALEVDKRIKKLDGEFGLMEWRHINPRSIRDKAKIILNRAKKPLHFVEIANKISEAHFDKKVVTTQAVHNDLIRHPEFVLVGRGLYALSDQGYKKGTVADVIEDLLSKNEQMTKQEIIKGVLKQRCVKPGTISLNLQKNEHFVRVGRAVYKLDKSKKA